MFGTNKNIVLSKHISPTHEKSAHRRSDSNDEQNLDIKHTKSGSGKDFNFSTNKAFDSNYSENGNWLDSKFASEKYRESKPAHIHSKNTSESHSKQSHQVFSKAQSGKKINDYILMGKVKNIQFQEGNQSEDDRSPSKNKNIISKAKLLGRINKKNLREAENEGTYLNSYQSTTEENMDSKQKLRPPPMWETSFISKVNSQENEPVSACNKITANDGEHEIIDSYGGCYAVKQEISVKEVKITQEQSVEGNKETNSDSHTQKGSLMDYYTNNGEIHLKSSPSKHQLGNTPEKQEKSSSFEEIQV